METFVPNTRYELIYAVKLWNFRQQRALEKYGNINTWNVSLITDMSDLFLDQKLFNSNISNWDVSNVTNMKNMFKNAKSFNQPIGNWNVSNVYDMSGMFYDAASFSP